MKAHFIWTGALLALLLVAGNSVAQLAVVAQPQDLNGQFTLAAEGQRGLGTTGRQCSHLFNYRRLDGYWFAVWHPKIRRR